MQIRELILRRLYRAVDFWLFVFWPKHRRQVLEQGKGSSQWIGAFWAIGSPILLYFLYVGVMSLGN